MNSCPGFCIPLSRANMASKHVDVNERRLRPVYDALDSMNNKKAIQQADKILKKQKDLHCAKVLKSIALLRSGKADESEKLMSEVKQVEPCDDATLQAMTICFREMEKFSEISEIYEVALKKNPKNEELFTHLFMSYVRTSQYKKQQQIAMNLYKSFQKNPYYFWAVMSNVMQANVCEDERTKTAMLLPLAERMIEKFIKEDKIEAEAEVALYLMVLEMQKKYEKALEVLNGKLGRFFASTVDKKKKEVEYLSKLEKWIDVNILYKNMIEDSPDDWLCYQGYLVSLLTLIKSNYVPVEDGDSARPIPHHKVSMAVDFINQLKKNELEKEHKLNRGPFLALLELLKQLRDHDMQDVCEGCSEDPSQLMVEYFKLFGDKSICFSDLVTYLDFVGDHQVSEFLDLCKSSISTPDESDVKENIRTLTRRICVEKMSRYLGEHDRLSAENKISLAKQCMSLHKDGLQWGKDLLSTDFQYSDDFALLAAHLLLDCCEESVHSMSLLRVLITLESALKSSPSNFQFKLLVSRLYCLVGAVAPCVTYVDGMDLKHVAHDTLGYNLTRYAAPLGHFESAMAIYNLALKLYHSNKKDKLHGATLNDLASHVHNKLLEKTPEYIIASYKYGSFEKIFELINFKERLENSFTYASVVYEQKFLEMVLLANSSASVQELFIDNKLAECCPHSRVWTDKVRDNRDLNILTSWNRSDRQSSKEMKETSFNHEILWLKLRVLIIRALGLAVTFLSSGNMSARNEPVVNNHVDSSSKTTNGTHDDDDVDNSTKFAAVLEELQDILNEVDSCGVKSVEFPVSGPLPTRWKPYLDGCYDKLLLCFLRITQVLHHVRQEPREGDKLRESVELIKKDFTTATNILSDNTNMCLKTLTVEDNGKHIFNGNVLEPLVLLLEAISIVLVFIACFRNLVLKITHMSKSKKKKMMLSPAKKELSEVFSSFVESLSSLVSQIHTQLLDEELLHLAEELITLDMNELHRLTDSSLLTTIWDKMQSSYKISVQEVSGVIKLKVNFLARLLI